MPAEEFLLSGCQVAVGLLQKTSIEGLKIAVQFIRSAELDDWKVALVERAFQRATREVQQHMDVPDGVLLDRREQLLKNLLRTKQLLLSCRDVDSMQLEGHYVAANFHMPLDHASASNSTTRSKAFYHSARVLLVVNEIGLVW